MDGNSGKNCAMKMSDVDEIRSLLLGTHLENRSFQFSTSQTQDRISIVFYFLYSQFVFKEQAFQTYLCTQLFSQIKKIDIFLSSDQGIKRILIQKLSR